MSSNNGAQPAQTPDPPDPAGGPGVRPGGATGPAPPGPVATGRVPPGSLGELRNRRTELAARVAALTWDLGGLAYEMAIRDHYRLDVIARRAAELQAADAEFGEVQRLLATAEAGIHGQCRSCGAVHSRGAAFCWHCGAPLLSEARPAVPAAPPAGAA